MNKCLIIIALALAACNSNDKTSPKPSKELTNNIDNLKAEGYFFKTGQPIPTDAIVIQTKEDFEKRFGYATTMSRRPTEIDFEKQAVIAIVLPETDCATEIKIDSVTSKGDDLEVLYSVQVGEKQSYTIQPLSMILVNKDLVKGNVVLTKKISI